MKKDINVLSLFDGIRCGMVALGRAGISVNNYYASELDKYAIQIANKNYPDCINLGDVTRWKEWDIDWSSIDLLIGGSPCQGFSFAGKQLNFDDPRSKLFFVYVDILNHIKSVNPDIKFLLENVRMKKEFQEVITEKLGGVEPILINSALISAQNRNRLYWANWEFGQPEDKIILLKDVVHEYFDNESQMMRDKSCIIRVGGKDSPPFSRQEWDGVYNKNKLSTFNINPSQKGMNGDVYSVNNPKSRTLTTNKGEGQKISVCLKEYTVPFDKTLQILDKEVEKGKVGYFRKDSQANRVYYIHDKAITLCGDAGGGAAKMGQYLFGCITPDRIEKRQNGQLFSEGKKFYTLTAQDKHGILVEGYIRKLTPIECERLQTLPDNYTNCVFTTPSGKQSFVSNSQRYKALGNGWTVDVIAHIFKGAID